MFLLIMLKVLIKEKTAVSAVNIHIICNRIKWIQNENNSENITNEKNVLDIHPFVTGDSMA